MKEIYAEKAIKNIAAREGITVAKVRKEMEKALLIGLCSQDPAVQNMWKKIPCKGNVPTPEEVIIYMAQGLKKHRYQVCFWNKKTPIA